MSNQSRSPSGYTADGIQYKVLVVLHEPVPSSQPMNFTALCLLQILCPLGADPGKWILLSIDEADRDRRFIVSQWKFFPCELIGYHCLPKIVIGVVPIRLDLDEIGWVVLYYPSKGLRHEFANSAPNQKRSGQEDLVQQNKQFGDKLKFRFGWNIQGDDLAEVLRVSLSSTNQYTSSR